MDILSPPYPRTNASPVALYRALCELYSWADTHRDWANSEAERLGSPENPFVPELGPPPLPEHAERFLNLAVPDMFMSWQALRQIRERYDDIVRNYEAESEWESDPSIYHRVNIVRMAVSLLSVAFLDSEKREAKGQEFQQAAFQALMKKLKHVFGSVGGMVVKFEAEGTPQEATEDIDFDKLFNPDSEEGEA